MEDKRRHRNVAHLWADKRIMRFFRKHFDKADYKNLRAVYLALCEIDSDFNESNEALAGFTQTVATYAGLSADTTSRYLRAMKDAGIIDYQQSNANGRFGSTSLILYKWEDARESEVSATIAWSLAMPTTGKFRRRKFPLAENSAGGVSGAIKNPKGIISKNPAKAGSSAEAATSEPSDAGMPITPSMFERFWQLYPRKVDKGKAKTKWEQICRKPAKDRPTWQVIEAAIEAQKGTTRWQDKKYIPHPTTWLNQQRWLDDPAEMNDNWQEQDHPEPVRQPVVPPKKIITAALGSTLGKIFFSDCFVPARHLLGIDFTNASEKAELARVLVRLHSQISAEQDKHLSREVRKLLPGPIDLVVGYINWIKENRWIRHRSLDMFDIGHSLFGRFRRDEAAKDNLSRDPVTGDPY